MGPNWPGRASTATMAATATTAAEGNRTKQNTKEQKGTKRNEKDWKGMKKNEKCPDFEANGTIKNDKE